MEEEFDLLVEKIFNSDFITKMNFDRESKQGIPKDIYMRLEPCGVHLSTWATENTYTGLDYVPSEDLFYAIRSGKVFDNETIYRMLDFQVPKDLLSDYHRQIIDSSPSTYKPIEICTLNEDIDKSNFKLLIDESEEKITLTKTKIRKR